MALKGKVLGVLGLGRIGGPVATIGLGFGIEVIAWGPNLTAERCAEKGVKLSGKDTLLVRSDLITIHLPACAATEGLIGAPELALMKPAALLINVSRASIVNEGALINALREGRIGGAGLDVFSVDPVPPAHPPHLGNLTDEPWKVHFSHVVEDIRAHLDGAPVRLLRPEP